MKTFATSLIIFLLFSNSSMAFVNFYIYIKNETDQTIIVNKDLEIRPHRQDILQSFIVSENQFLQEKLHLKGSIHLKKPSSPLCQYDFNTYTILDSEEQEFKTFLIVQKTGNKYTCEPVAAEVFPQGNSIKKNGVRLSISEALVRHENWKKQIESSGQGNFFMIRPNVGIQQTYKALIKRSH